MATLCEIENRVEEGRDCIYVPAEFTLQIVSRAWYKLYACFFYSHLHYKVGVDVSYVCMYIHFFLFFILVFLARVSIFYDQLFS